MDLTGLWEVTIFTGSHQQIRFKVKLGPSTWETGWLFKSNHTGFSGQTVINGTQASVFALRNKYKQYRDEYKQYRVDVRSPEESGGLSEYYCSLNSKGNFLCGQGPLKLWGPRREIVLKRYLAYDA